MDTTYIIYGILFIILVGTAVQQVYIHKRISKLVRGKNSESLEDSITEITKRYDNILSNHKELVQALESFNTRLKEKTISARTIRFNPFEDQGGKQSFATALLDENGDGIVFSSLYSREKTSVFAKPIKNYISEFDLTNEETKVLEQVKER